jgi:hypothetical protein
MNRLLCLLLLLALPASASAAALGRLFYTPEQRSGLEQARQQKRAATADGTTAAPKPLTYDGIVLRSDGRATRWIDGKPQPGGAYSLRSGGRLLRPGQTLDGNRVYEAHGIRRSEADTTP